MIDSRKLALAKFQANAFLPKPYTAEKLINSLYFIILHTVEIYIVL